MGALEEPVGSSVGIADDGSIEHGAHQGVHTGAHNGRISD